MILIRRLLSVIFAIVLVVTVTVLAQAQTQVRLVGGEMKVGETDLFALQVVQAPQGIWLLEGRILLDGEGATILGLNSSFKLEILEHTDRDIRFRWGDLRNEVKAGATDIDLLQVEVQATSPGEIPIHLEVTLMRDDAGVPLQPEVESGMIRVTSLNRPPTAVAAIAGSYSGNECQAISFDGSGSTDPDGDPLQYRWDFENDGAWDTDWSVSSRASYTWSDPLSGTVRLEVRDGCGGNDTDVASVTVDDVPPILTPISDKTLAAGSILRIDVLATGAGCDTLVFSITDLPAFGSFTDNGDGTASIIFQPSFGDIGSYTINVTVTDDDGTSDSCNFSLTVTAPSSNGEGGEVAPPPLPNQPAPPMDLNEDGLYEDLNGDGEFTLEDIILFSKYIESVAVQDYSSVYDYNEDGSVDLLDAYALGSRLQTIDQPPCDEGKRPLVSLEAVRSAVGKKGVLHLTLVRLPAGLQRFDVGVRVDDVGVVSLAYGTVEIDERFVEVITDGPAEVRFRVADFHDQFQPGMTEINLAQIHFEPLNIGKTNISIIFYDFVDDQGQRARPIVKEGSVEVLLPTVIPGEAPPLDLNGDGLYEDVDGDGVLSGRDALVLAFNYSFALPQNYACYFDFNRDGELDFKDAVALVGLVEASRE
jgi:PKD repeat protein